MKHLITTTGLAACLLLAACAKGGGATDDKVFATVDGEKITASDVQVETALNGGAAQQGQPEALQRVIDRKLMAAVAKKDGLDRPAGFQAESERAGDDLLAGALIRKISSETPKPTAAEITQFIAAHPEAFAERKFLVLEQIQVRKPEQGLPMIASQPGRTMEGIQAALDAQGVPYYRSMSITDTANTQPSLVAQLMRLGPGGTFETNRGDLIVIGRVVEVRNAPLGGPFARELAQNYLLNQRTSAAVRSRAEALRKDAKIEYAEGYAPTAKTAAP